MKNLLLSLIYFICGAFIGKYVYITLNPTTDLEIYTSQDIIYVKGLTVTFESSDEVLKFDTPEQLKDYISNLTAEQSK